MTEKSLQKRENRQAFNSYINPVKAALKARRGGTLPCLLTWFLKLFVVLTIILLFSFSDIPFFNNAVEVQAAGSGAVLTDMSVPGAQYGTRTYVIYYGGKQYWIMGYNGNGVASNSGGLTLIDSRGNGSGAFIGGNIAFDDTEPYSNVYSGSNLQKVINAISLSEAEKSVIRERSLNGIGGSSVTAKIWPLSDTEAGELPTTLKNVSDWWTRSPSEYLYGAYKYPCAFYYNNTQKEIQYEAVKYNRGARPALELNLTYVFFSSKSGTSKASSFSKINTSTPTSLKLTLYDKGSTAPTVSIPSSGSIGSNITVNITSAGRANTSGVSYTRLSAMLTGTDGKQVYAYGKIDDSPTKTGNVSFTIPDGLDAGTYKLWIFPEDVNGNNETDYACYPASQTIQLNAAYTVEYNANGGSGAPEAQKKIHGETLTLSSTKPVKADSTSDRTVNFNANGGESTGAEGNSINATATTKYTFSKWNTKADGTGTDYNSGGSYTADEAVTLFAQYTSNTTCASFTLPTPSRAGYRCIGWYTAATDGTKAGDAGGSFAPLSDTTELFAHWEMLPATAPTVTATGANLTYGYTTGSVSVTATAATDHSISYQWYSNGTTNSSTGGTLIPDATGLSYTVPTGLNVGDYYFYCVVKAKRDDNGLSASATGVAKVTVSKAASSVTAPTAKSLTYSGSAQELVNPGTPVGGTIQYKLNSGSFSGSIPKSTEAGNYTVWYKVVGDSNHNDLAEQSISVTISPKTVTPEISAIAAVTYTGSAHTPSVTVKDGSTTIPVAEYSVAYSNNINAGTATVTVTDKNGGNYKINEKSVTFTINKADINPTVSISGWIYGNAASTPDVTGNTGSGAISYSYKKKAAGDDAYTSEVPSDAGNYTIRATIGESTNYNGATATADFTISKAASSVTAAPTANNLTYNGSDQTLLVGGTANGGTMKYSTSKTGTYSETIPTGRNAVEYTVWYKVVGDSNHEDTAPVSMTVTIAKKTVKVTSGITASNKVYDGTTEATLNTSGAVFDGICSGDVLTVTATGTFNDANIGTGKRVALTGFALGGASDSNYSLSSVGNLAETTADITRRGITIKAKDQTIVYGNPIASDTGKITASEGGLVAGDSVASVTLTPDLSTAGTGNITPSNAVIKKGSSDVTGNYEITCENGILTISPAELTGVSVVQNGVLTYNGSLQRAEVTKTATAVNDQAVRFTYSLSSSEGFTNQIPAFSKAGKYVVFYRAEADNHNQTGNYFEVTINKRPVSVSGITASDKTYDGTAAAELKFDNASFDGKINGDDLTVTASGAFSGENAKDAGENKTVTITGLTLDGAAKDNYELSEDDQSSAIASIKKRKVTLSSASASKVYDGTALTNGTVNISGEGFVSGEGATFTVTGAQTVIGESQNSFTYTLNDGTKAANYEITTVTGTLTVTRKPMESVSVAQSGTLTYNGAEQIATVTATSDAPGAEFTYSSVSENGTYDAAVPAFINAGEHTVYYRVTAANYEDKTGSFIVTIGKRPITVKASDQTIVYGQSPGSYAENNTLASADGLVTGHILSAVTLTPSGKDVMDNGTLKPETGSVKIMSGDEDVTSNYQITPAAGTLKITPAGLTVTANDKTIIYGDAPADAGVRFDGLTGGDDESIFGSQPVSYAYSYAQFGDVGDSYTITPSGLTHGNYNITFVSGTLKVIRREAGISWSSENQWLYDGTSHIVTASATNTVNSDTVSFTVVGEQTDAGSYTAQVTGITGDKAGNYRLPATGTTAGFSITKRAVTLTSATAEKKYDGSPLTAGEVTVSGDGFIDGQGADFNVTGSQKLVGESDNTFTYTLHEGTKADNYTIDTVYGKLKVTPLEGDEKLQITVTSRSDTVTYDGEAHSLSGFDGLTFTVSGADYNVEGITTAEINEVNAGTYNNTVTGEPVVRDSEGNDVTSQFSVNIQTGKLIIDQRDISGAAVSFGNELIYNGQEQTQIIESVVADGVSIGAEDYTVTGNTGTGSGTYSMTITGRRNCTGTVTKEFTIGKAELTGIGAVQNGTLTYTGSPQTADVATQSDIAGVGFKYKASQDGEYSETVPAFTDAGSHTVYYLVGSSDGNYTDFTGSFTVTIEKKSVTVSWGAEATWLYDGKEHVPEVTMSGIVEGDGSSAQISGQQKHAGSHTASVSVTGEKAGNYLITGDASKVFTINKRNIVLKSKSDEKVYDGSPLKNNKVTVTGDGFVDGEGIKITMTGSQTEPGSSKNTFKYKFKEGTTGDDYTIKAVYGTLTVKPDDKSSSEGGGGNSAPSVPGVVRTPEKKATEPAKPASDTNSPVPDTGRVKEKTIEPDDSGRTVRIYIDDRLPKQYFEDGSDGSHIYLKDEEQAVRAILSGSRVGAKDGSVDIRIVVSEKQDGLSGVERERLESGLKVHSEMYPGLRPDKLLDISIYYRLGEGEWNPVKETSEPIRIVIDLPAEMKVLSDEFYVMRIHENECTLLFDMDEDNDTITIETGLFSSYALLYREKTEEDEGISEKSDKGDDPEIEKLSSGGDIEKKMFPWWIIVAVIAFALIIAVVVIIRKKRRA